MDRGASMCGNTCGIKDSSVCSYLLKTYCDGLVLKT